MQVRKYCTAYELALYCRPASKIEPKGHGLDAKLDQACTHFPELFNSGKCSDPVSAGKAVFELMTSVDDGWYETSTQLIEERVRTINEQPNAVRWVEKFYWRVFATKPTLMETGGKLAKAASKVRRFRMFRVKIVLVFWTTVLLLDFQLMGQVSTASRDECSGAFGSNHGMAVIGFTGGSLFAPNAGGLDTFVKKYSPTGLVQWTRQFGSNAADFGADVTMDAEGNVYVLGTTAGAISTRVGGRDVFLRKYDPAGTTVWTRQFGTAADDLAIEVATDTLGNIFVLAQENLALPNPGFVIRRFNRQGAALQRVQVANRPGLIPRGLTVDSANQVIVLTDWLDDAGTGQNILLYKYTGSLVQVWQRKYQTNESDRAYDVAASGTNIYFTAHYGNFGARVLKINEAGAIQWARSLEPPNATRTATFPDAIATDASGSVYVTGSNFEESYPGFHHAGAYDVIAFKFDSAGNRLWMTQMDDIHHGTDQIDAGQAIAVSGIAYVVGSTFGDMQLGLERALLDEDGFVAGLDPTSGAVLGIDQYLPIGP